MNHQRCYCNRQRGHNTSHKWSKQVISGKETFFLRIVPPCFVRPQTGSPWGKHFICNLLQFLAWFIGDIDPCSPLAIVLIDNLCIWTFAHLPVVEQTLLYIFFAEDAFVLEIQSSSHKCFPSI